MVHKAKLTKSDFQKILKNYNLGSLIEVHYFNHGGVQTTALLTTTFGKYVLRYYNTRSPKHVSCEVNLLNFLKIKKYPVPAILKKNNSGYVGLYKARPYIIIEYVEGGHKVNPNKEVDFKDLSKVVELTARLHKITREFLPSHIHYHEVFNPQYCRKQYLKQKRKVKVKERMWWFKNELASLQFPSHLPKGICHADLNYSNILFKNNKVAAVLDFDVSFYWYLIYDMANLVYWWAWPPKKELDIPTARFIMKEYAKYRKLNAIEKFHIFDALKLIILTGISWSKENEFEPEKRKIKYLNNLGREEFNVVLFSA